VASANSPLALARRGVQQYLDLGVPAGKLVLGLPWCACRSARSHESRSTAAPWESCHPGFARMCRWVV